MHNSVQVKYRQIYLALVIVWVSLLSSFALSLVQTHDGQLHMGETDRYKPHEAENNGSAMITEQRRTTKAQRHPTHIHCDYQHDSINDISTDADRDISLNFTNGLFEKYSTKSSVIFMKGLKNLLTKIRLGAMFHDDVLDDSHKQDAYHSLAEDNLAHDISSHGEQSQHHDAHNGHLHNKAKHDDYDSDDREHNNNQHHTNSDERKNHKHNIHLTDDDKHTNHNDKHDEDHVDLNHYYDRDDETHVDHNAPGSEKYDDHRGIPHHHDTFEDPHESYEDWTQHQDTDDDKQKDDKDTLQHHKTDSDENHDSEDDRHFLVQHQHHLHHHHQHHHHDGKKSNHNVDNGGHGANKWERNSPDTHGDKHDGEVDDYNKNGGDNVQSTRDGQYIVQDTHNNDDDDDDDNDDSLDNSQHITARKPLRNLADKRKNRENANIGRKIKSKSRKNKKKKKKNRLLDSEMKSKVSESESPEMILQRHTRQIATEYGHAQEDRDARHDSAARSVDNRTRMNGQTNKCLSLSEIMALFNYSRKDHVTQSEFLYLCPVLISQLESGNCDRRINNAHIHHTQRHKTWNFGDIPGKVWGFSTLAVTVISLVGLLGVAIIPIMHKVFYNHLLQFLVALAVGALSGDALLHLLPHAIAGVHGAEEHAHAHGDGSDESGHNMAHGLWQGFTALMAIYFFFLIERIVIIITQIKDKRKSNKRRRTYGTMECASNTSTGKMLSSNDETEGLRQYGHHKDDDGDTCESYSYNDHQDKHAHISNGAHDPEAQPSHGHIHGPLPGSVAAIAWMVILGDGIHNFSDGLAIGVAFSNSIAGGFATSVAVFCHELPHEIGDFAVLLRAGMSVKQAVVYNCVSSVLCFIGMLFGVALGNVNTASLWIFAAVGGMFLYIALVDMLPEMTSANGEHVDNPFLDLLLQMLGMLLGASVMFVIALYEDDLRSTFDS